MHFVLGKNVFDYFLVQMSQLLSTVQLHPSEFSWSYQDLRRVTIQSDTHLLKLSAYLDSVLLCLGSLEHHQDHI